MKRRQPPQKRFTAEELLSPGQQVLACTLLALAVTEGVVFGPLALLRTVVALVITFYVVFVGFKIALWAAARTPSAPNGQIPWGSLPTYSILVPLHDEARMVAPLAEALMRLTYPVNKLQILLLLEADDTATIEAVRAANLPSHFQPVIVPNVGPRTKPKACNYGYSLATGERVVIFDAEDRPDPDQLVKAVQAFAITRHGRPVGCLQAALSFWNPRRSLVSTFYWAEYMVHFMWTLPGLARLGLIPPLGGTSNHFLREALEAVTVANGDWVFSAADGTKTVMRGPWDPYNVTEDADLAIRLAKAGYRIGILPGTTTYSTTYEEAPHRLRIARNQRSRWLKGYTQTGLVHTRRPFRSMRQLGVLQWAAFNLLMLGTPIALLLNPIMLGTTILYVVARLDSIPAVSTFIEGLFPAPVYWLGMGVALGGNAALYFQKLATPLLAQWHAEHDPAEQQPLARHLHQQEYGLVGRLSGAPVWWTFTSSSAYQAVLDLTVPSRRAKWKKTPHGHDLAIEAELGM